MKFSISKTVGINAAVMAMGLSSLTALAAPSTNAMPFGLEIGVATCETARARLGQVEETKLDGNDLLLRAAAPSTIYEGASKAVVRCSDGKVIAVQIEAPKGGMGNGGSRDVYANLSKKYKVVAGGAMPQLGNGYARFAAGNSIIEQDSPHLSFVFTVTYYKKSFYDSIVASNKDKDKKAREKKESSL